MGFFSLPPNRRCSSTVRNGISHTVQGMLGNQVIHHGRFEHRPHGDVCLLNRRPGIAVLHAVQDQLTVHGLDIGQQHTTDNRLDILNIPPTVIPTGVGSQIADNMLNPVCKPFVHHHIRRNKHMVVLVGIPGVFRPVAGFRKDEKLFLVPFAAPIYKSCAVQTILSLANTLAAFFAFQVFTHFELLSRYEKKSPMQQDILYHGGFIFSISKCYIIRFLRMYSSKSFRFTSFLEPT